ncbi:MAG: hypothetical protein DMG39_07600 [Acidobacteria bacterium]|nr:MAG: hypothetical protein DMG39_07600 [Acidobacteriota bacterium]
MILSQHIIDLKLRELGCPVSLFVPIAGIIGRTRLTQALQHEPGKNLDRNLEDKLITVLDEMAELKRTSLVAPDWSDSENIREELRQRRALKLAAKYDEDKVRELFGVGHGETSN